MEGQIQNGRRPAKISKSSGQTKAQKTDDSIMGTNNSSIVSKRSVERLYFPNEPHFFRYFVKKPLRRSPLINRGYWLRMKAIDHVVKQFLEQRSEKQRVVINLGCGYDPLPWQCMSRYPTASQDVKFIDIDYRDLMVKKQTVVRNTSELNSMLTNLNITQDGDILLSSDQYLQLGCDLRNLKRLEETISKVVDIEKCSFLFTAEVSITYMPTESADALIQWANKLPDARFCLLEQLLPEGISHPFAQTMMAHFDKLGTPLGACKKYPTVAAQDTRFRSLGWPSVLVRNLWELWGSEDFLDSKERIALDSVEPFDEWEEFALFGCHYLLLVADNTSTMHRQAMQESCEPTLNGPGANHTTSTYSEYPKAQGQRRFAAPLSVRARNRGQYAIGNFSGMGLNTRVSSCDVYSADDTGFTSFDYQGSHSWPSSRMCHTITGIDDGASLLIGGRTSPDNAIVDCWIYHKWLNIWERVDDLPKPRYRHSAAHLGNGYVMMTGGKSTSKTLVDDVMIWSRQRGWVKCSINSNERPPAFFGSSLVVYPETFPHPSASRSGIIAGGITEDGLVQEKTWKWKISQYRDEQPSISFKNFDSPSTKAENGATLARFGAQTLVHEDNIVVVGGIVKDILLPLANEICSSKIESMSTTQHVVCCTSVSTNLEPRPLLIGTSAVSSGDKILIMGGSAVCFSFGTFWNKGCYSLTVKRSDTSEASNGVTYDTLHGPWKFMRTIDGAPSPKTISTSLLSATPGTQSLVKVPRVKLNSSMEFDKILDAGKPIILEGLDTGVCTKEWTSDYLKDKVGADREVIVHEASTEHMNFSSKNFTYVTKKFGDFLDEVEKGSKLYLRSLSAEKASELPADIVKDYPSISADFQLPLELASVTHNAHSSPLRISGPVNMWLHYDVMANVLCQVRGSKRLLLFPPSDVKYFDFAPGASSSSINVFENLSDPKLSHTHPHEVILQPGDILFLPSLWLHTASPTSGISVAVNVFFRNLRNGYAAGKDVYGNRDLQAYEKGRQDIAKVVKSFESLPTDVRGFYLQRLADEFMQMAT
ncbi:hypothetical protein sscle_15g103760 [Sclerotinia sclerotiorum 1980 UF-70]|uniref:tRNA wybutosine-synthesizing protein 4 n=1 Tax=Sclerotinia sclerotiorum (strain ATCC 18683 / 1980 / Ss-1) TaxID=665079 RepID=A0A1D9QKZ8_SCLS1|nr:hypothetical protein sscle_15g103760 [Sclerotinia sclerotiorum 1980 UF-70]